MKKQINFAALSFVGWVEVFNSWLQAWQWQTQVGRSTMHSLDYQLLNRWQAALEEFAAFSSVQSHVGLSRALELLQQLAHNTVFLPKGVATPIVISGVFEAMGREVDTCILTGMNQDYPAPTRQDAFISNRFLAEAGHPESTVGRNFEHSQAILKNLLSCSKNHIVSYALSNERNQEISMRVSPVFRAKEFQGINAIDDAPGQDGNPRVDQTPLENYVDLHGPAWDKPELAKGGSKIFENQSNCAFKAFVTHQLSFNSEDEAEFGLDGLDRGNVLHHLLDILWGEINNQEYLLSLDSIAMESLVSHIVDKGIDDQSLKLTSEKATLLKHEKPRLEATLLEWLEIEAARPVSFSVVEREEAGHGDLGGIAYRYIIDRVDLTEDGRSVIIDYKTGLVNRSDWLGERIRSPQLPLYALALDAKKNNKTSGIAYAQLKDGDLKYIELSETNIFRKENTNTSKYEEQWLKNRGDWPTVFAKLAEDFLAGYAEVNPIEKSTCNYCDLTAVCRVSQLRDQLANEASRIDDLHDDL